MKKKYSLKENHVFNDVLKKGYKINTHYFLLSKKGSKGLENIHIGISIPKKFGNAVFRNKQKRQIRWIMANFLKENDVKDIPINVVILVKKPFIDLSFLDKSILLEQNLKKLLRNNNGK